MIANENDALVLTNAYAEEPAPAYIFGSVSTSWQAWRFLHNLKARLK